MKINNNCLVLSHAYQPYLKFHLGEYGKYFADLKVIYYMDYLKEYGKQGLDNYISSYVEQHKIDILILWQWYETAYAISLELLVELKKSCKVILWTFDDEVFFDTTSKYYANIADVAVTTDYYAVKRYEQLDIRSIWYFSSYDKNTFYHKELVKDIDVSFIGGEKSNRMDYINFLRQNNINISLYGGINQSCFLAESDMVDIMLKSKINLNFSGIFMPNVAKLDNALLYRCKQNKGRLIEVSLCGSFCLSEYSPATAQLFEDDEIPQFYSKEDLLEKIKYYLSHYDEANKMAEKAHRRALENYSSDVYIPKVLGEINDICSKYDSGIYSRNYLIVKSRNFERRAALFDTKIALYRVVRKRKFDVSSVLEIFKSVLNLCVTYLKQIV